MDTCLKSFFRLFALNIFMTDIVFAASLPPPPQDTKLAEVYEQAKSLYEKSKSKSYLEMPSTPNPWPCEVTELQLRKFAGALTSEELDLKEQKKLKRIFSDMGISMKGIKEKYSDVHYAPIIASCRNGKLDGDLEFIIEYTKVSNYPDYVHKVSERKRKHITLFDGEYKNQGIETEVIMNISDEMTFINTEVQAAAARDNSPKSKYNSTRCSELIGEDVSYTASIVELITDKKPTTVLTSLSLPTGANKMQSMSYDGSTLIDIFNFKNNVMHGEHHSYARVIEGFQIPESIQCFENGEEIKTTKCDVE